MTPLLSMGESLSVSAALYPDRIGARDLSRSMTFRQWNERACRLANALLGLGLGKGDRVAVLAYNCVEWLEIYAAVAKAGLIVVPINFRLLGEDILFILENSGARAFIVQEELMPGIEEIRARLPVSERNLIQLSCGEARPQSGITDYESLLSRGAPREPGIPVSPEDTWALMYTSGTTGKPKGAMRSHGSHALLSFATLLDLQFRRDDTCLLVMPMCHANSLFFASAFAYGGAACCVYDRKSFDPEHMLRTFAETRATFTSLVPTHYIMMLGLSAAIKGRHNVDSVRKLLISSAPARPSRAGRPCCGPRNSSRSSAPSAAS
jgi:acyl-CoA synthetase (AMP-forming)/AMP-acid ligase II